MFTTHDSTHLCIQHMTVQIHTYCMYTTHDSTLHTYVYNTWHTTHDSTYICIQHMTVQIHTYVYNTWQYIHMYTTHDSTYICIQRMTVHTYCMHTTHDSTYMCIQHEHMYNVHVLYIQKWVFTIQGSFSFLMTGQKIFKLGWDEKCLFFLAFKPDHIQ